VAKVLFILKRREDYGQDNSYSETGISTGLLNSATFVKDMLNKNGISSELVIVIDNNDIDREVTIHEPTHVIIEAVWVVPEKFEILRRLYPNVKWIIRYHSETPFIANEGIALKWFYDYVKQHNVYVSANSKRFMHDLRIMMQSTGASCEMISNKLIYLPNYYPVEEIHTKRKTNKPTIDIGCFGAIRPLKNHLNQAVAALQYANRIGKKLNFHINIGRTEMKGDSILNNLKNLFSNTTNYGHNLITHQWSKHSVFVNMIKSTIDVGMQVSFTETFNIVAADMVTAGVPIVTSNEIPWAIVGNAYPTSTDSMVSSLFWAHNFPKFNVILNSMSLKRYGKHSEFQWLSFFQKELVGINSELNT
jgi:hypothetical protein